MSKVRTCLWFDQQAKQAVDLYVAVIPDSKVEKIVAMDHALTGETDGVQIIEFTLGGAPYLAMNAGPHEAFNDAASIAVTTKDQAETDRCWHALLADGGRPMQCGWLKDRFGLSWQIIPEALPRLLGAPDKEKAGRAMKAMLAMQKIDIAALEAAANAA